MSRKESLKQELETTRQAFHELLAAVPESAYGLRSDNPAWNVGEVLYHMSLAPRLLGRDVTMITGRNPLYRLIPKLIPARLFHWLNEKMTRYGARQLSPAGLAAAYDEAHEMALAALAAVSEHDLDKAIEYPDWDPLLSGRVTLERLFRYVKIHFEAHAEQIRLIVAAA